MEKSAKNNSVEAEAEAEVEAPKKKIQIGSDQSHS